MKRDNFLIILTVCLTAALILLIYFMFTNGSQKNAEPLRIPEDSGLSALSSPVSAPVSGASQSESSISAEKPAGKMFALMKTSHGDIKLELFPADAQKTVDNFIKLSESGFYNGTKFHRIIKDFMIQGGDPNSKNDIWFDDGGGGPGYQFEDEINQHKLVRGTLAMANSGPDTNGSQFFIVTAAATPWLDGHHTVFGQVVEGMDIVDKIENVPTDKNKNDHPTVDVVVNSVEIIKQ